MTARYGSGDVVVVKKRRWHRDWYPGFKHDYYIILVVDVDEDDVYEGILENGLTVYFADDDIEYVARSNEEHRDEQ